MSTSQPLSTEQSPSLKRGSGKQNAASSSDGGRRLSSYRYHGRWEFSLRREEPIKAMHHWRHKIGINSGCFLYGRYLDSLDACCVKSGKVTSDYWSTASKFVKIPPSLSLFLSSLSPSLSLSPPALSGLTLGR